MTRILASSLSIIFLVSSILLPWQFFNNADAQDEGQEEENGDTQDTNNNNSDDNAYSVIIPENAAWSETINERFNPSNITIPVGTEVTWINEDESQHTVTSGNVTNQGRDGIYDGRFYSGLLGSEDLFSHIFNEPGTYSYFCSPHPWMTGFVIVDGSVQDADVHDDEEEENSGADDEEEQGEDDEDEDE